MPDKNEEKSRTKLSVVTTNVKKAQDNDELSDRGGLSQHDLERLEAMNAIYTHAYVGGKNLIISETASQVNNLALSFDPIPEFKKRFLHHPRISKKNPADAWLAWPGKNCKLNGAGFYPDPRKCPGGVFNFFQGFAVEPVKGDCKLYLDHLKNIICSGENEPYEYLIQYLAHMIQKPDEKPTVAIYLKSVEGTGKGSMVYPLLKILGNHGAQTNGAHAIVGRFNGTIANKLLLFADEVELRGNRTSDKIKAIISESTVMLERKGLEIEPLPNYCRLIFASNHDHVINAGIRERRYLMLTPSDAMVGNKAYFNVFRKWADNGGVEALFDYLLNLDIYDFNPYACPQTKALIDEKLASLPLIYQFFYREIFQNEPFGGGGTVKASELVAKYLIFCEDKDRFMNLYKARASVGKTMHKLKIQVIGRSDRGDGKLYNIPDKEVMQVAFAQELGVHFSDIQLLN